GMTAGQLFDIAVEAVEDGGITPYRRHHCGHAIGSDVYEWPSVAPNSDAEWQAGMVFCVETPYYCLGWGGMMVEDAIQITDKGNKKLTSLDRSLRVVPA
ncbi:MAG: M24 family metallopeptidase, partial [Dehalococcoidia bacterium]|nr:M24 family metallopeptidase [Dehalococcoidia bacterium]